MFSSIEGESNKYVAHSCNFFLFPTTFGILDSEFSFQASSVQFLNQYGFDYNKFLKNGIPYMNEEQEKKIKHSILRGNWRVRSSLDKDQIKVVIDKVTQWLDLAEEGDQMTLPGIAVPNRVNIISRKLQKQAHVDIGSGTREAGFRCSPLVTGSEHLFLADFSRGEGKESLVVFRFCVCLVLPCCRVPSL
uniref:Uncharacterized protein n=1 Tax=Mus musculus TaxID=10090 RepID=Q3UTD2_MOUSE|nr:unnamed protein product [Mus musculus]